MRRATHNSDASPVSALDRLPQAPRWRFSTVALLCGLFALVVASFLSLSLTWSAFFTQEAVRTTFEFLHGFAPPELSTPFLLKIAVGMAETLSMSALGTILAAIVGVALGLVASGRFGGTARAATRTLLNVLRAIPELVWASILLISAGLGPFAGTLALAAHTSGVLGRLFADAYENTSSLPEATLRINGVRAIPAFLYATMPQTLPQMMSYTLYRWENNIRAAAILGVVGAGGLGQMLKYHLSLFQMPQAASVIVAMLAMVATVDGLSFMLRRAMTR
ncbi:phosphonate ABC transporter, permease protein PhnE [Glaciimonas sp. Gout2]|uniref:phosphonate ABC transporter, permease protein PhnE n=1 Tax=unclassified Glaciimonas TaxID=2644401 RepID=UPI002AB4AAD3|nr:MULTISPECIES: phosphonate ABC transporter, permease protein PhnE [unclassified Glaciimonas]MDY7549007.1 phosphonate ABC transporter, permease protein PhnE [Glaciimonas sp. CA11.2]MEB0013199.1 phosphonate ABC transporter, permease protein PhnE [Glaciimonas sp. Cout2]MEB0081918.1 phosphonate ABC transporter, permease protein PhnE [Glaciimonas sp. Gout2]